MKALFIPFAPSLAHVTRCLSVAEAWRHAGHKAVFAVGRERTALISDHQYEVHEVPEIPRADFQNDRGFRWLSEEYICRNVDAEKSLIKRIQPDVVIFDFRFTSVIAGHLTRCPTIGIIHGNAALLADNPRKAAKFIFTSAEKTAAGFDLRTAIFSKVFPLGFQFFMRKASRRLNRCLERYGMQPVQMPFEMLFGEHTLVADIPELMTEPLRNSAQVVGPLLWSGWSRPEPVLSIIGNAPLIYITMGTTVESSRLVLQLIECMKNSPYQLIVSTGGADLDLKSVPENVHILHYVSGQTIIQQSRLVIHHGGHETLMQALAAGVPSLVIPINPDQLILSRQIADRKFGKCLRKPNAFPMDENPIGVFSSKDIYDIIEETINDSQIQESCQRARTTVMSFQTTNIVGVISNFLEKS